MADDDSDSDDVQFVGECDFMDTLPKRLRPAESVSNKPSIQVNRNKYANKRNHGGSDSLEERSNSPKITATAAVAPLLAPILKTATVVGTSSSIHDNDVDDVAKRSVTNIDALDSKAEDLDVDKIMSALKELQVREFGGLRTSTQKEYTFCSRKLLCKKIAT